MIRMVCVPLAQDQPKIRLVLVAVRLCSAEKVFDGEDRALPKR